MKNYAKRGYKDNSPQRQVEEDEDFDINDEWQEGEFDENVSHASSRAANTIVEAMRDTKFRNQEVERESGNRPSPPKRATNFNYRVVSDENYAHDGNAYEEGDYLVVGEEVVVQEEQADPEIHRDFKSAYNKLVEKVHLEQGNDLLLNEDELVEAMKKKELRKQLKERTDGKIKEFNENKRRKMELIKQEKDQKEVEECTFAPQLFAKPYGQRRNFDQFLEDQRKHEENKALKRNIILEHESQIEMGAVYHPEINETSRKMLANRKDADKPVHERLYGISKTSKINQIINETEPHLALGSESEVQSNIPAKSVLKTEQETFAPKINQRSKEIVRDKPVQELLYNDALRRKDMSELRQQKTNLKEMNKRSRELNESNIEYLIHRFNKEFEPTFETVIKQNEDENTELLNYRQLGELLFDMGFLSGSASSESEERILLSSMWTGLGGAQNEGVNKEVVRAFLLAAEGVKITDSVKAPSEEEFGVMKDGEFYPDCPKISKHFKLMYLNRIRYCRDANNRKKKIESEANQNWTFQPVLSDTTQNLAQKYRQKIADNVEGGKVTVLDILTAQTTREQWIEETKKEMEMRAAQEWTFHPITNENIPIRQDESIQSTGDKWFDLFLLASTKQKNKVDKSKDEYEYEKYGQECTFRPNTKKELKRDGDRPHYINQRSIQDNYERMKKAREEREFKKKMTERGYGASAPSTANPTQNKQSARKPTNYSRPAKEPKVNTKVVEESKQKKVEVKDKDNPKAKNASKRRTPQERSEVARETKSSQAKKAANPPPVAKPTPKASKPTRDDQKKEFEEQAKEQYVDHIEKYEDNQDEERQQVEDRYDNEIDSNEIQHDDRNQDEIAQYANQEFSNYDAHSDNEPEIDQEDDQRSPNENEDEQEEQRSQDEEGEGNPLLFVDVNLGPGRSERIVVYEGDTAEQLADEFTKNHGLDGNLKEKLVDLLEKQIAGLLGIIDEEHTSNDTENHD